MLRSLLDAQNAQHDGKATVVKNSIDFSRSGVQSSYPRHPNGTTPFVEGAAALPT
jgi:hypothetical protein